MTMRSVALAVVLVAVQGSALAQTGQAPDPNCPFNEGTQKRQLTPGRITTMTIKIPAEKSHLPCNGNSICINDVEVQSFNRKEGGAEACCTRVTYGEMRVKQRDKNVPLKWEIKPLDRKSYVFNTDGVHFLPPPTPTPGDFEPPTYPGNRKFAKMISVNALPGTFNYGVSVSLKRPDGTYLACDPNDPVIVNQGN